MTPAATIITAIVGMVAVVGGLKALWRHTAGKKHYVVPDERAFRTHTIHLCGHIRNEGDS